MKTTRLHLSVFRLPLLLLAAAFLCTSSAWAASGSWNAAPTDANWVPTGTNWSNGATLFPGATSGTANADTATFNGGSTQTAITINSTTLNIKSITFDLAGAAAYTIGSTGGNALLLTSGGSIVMNAAVANTETVNAPLQIQTAAGSYTITNNATSNSALLNIGGAITGGAAGQTNLNINGSNTGNNTISGNISAGGATYFSLAKGGAGTWVLSGTDVLSNSQNYQSALSVGGTGTLNIQGDLTITLGSATVASGATLKISGANGYIHGTSLITVNGGGTLLVDDTGVGGAKAARDASAITLGNNALFSYVGSDQASTNTSATVGAFTLGSGISKFTVGYSGTNTATVTAAAAAGGFTRTASTGGIALINGTNLGAATSGTGQFLTATTPTLVGTTAGGSSGIDAAHQNTQIARFLLGESGLSSGQNGTVTGTANTFLTYNATTGYRPLNPAQEFTNNAITAATNTYLTTGTTTTSGTNAINSLVVNGGNLSITSGALTNTSGMLLFAQNGTISGAGTFTFGTAEGIVAVNSGVNATISSPLSAGATGLTVYGTGSLTLSGANSYAGTTAFGVGSTLIVGSNSALGTSTITAGGGTLKGDGQPRTISNMLIDTTSGMIVGGSSNLTFNGAVAWTNTTFANTAVVVNNSATTTISGIYSLNNSTTGSNNGGSILALGSSANVVITGAIQDNNSSNVALPSTGWAPSFTGAGANLTINPTSANNNFASNANLKGGTIFAPNSSYNTVTIGGPSGAPITPFGNYGLVLNNGNTLYLAAATSGQTLGNNIIASGNSGTLIGFVGANSMTLGGNWTMAASAGGDSFTNLATATFTFGGTISRTGGTGVSFLGTGNTTLNSSSSMSAGAYALTATQSGTLTLSNTNNFTGLTNFSGGTVVLDYSTNNTTKLTQNGGAVSVLALTLSGVNLQLSGGSYAQGLGSTNGTTLGSGQSKITRPSGTSTIALGGITRNAGSTIDFATGIASTTTANSSGVLGGYATVGGTDWATGGGTIAALGSYDSFASPGTNKNILQNNSGSVAASVTVNSLKITTSTGSQSLAIGASQNLGLSSGGLLFTGTNDYSITGGTLNTGAVNTDLVVSQNGTGVLTIGSQIVNGGGGASLTKSGSGTLVLSNATNTLSGGVYLNAGILSISASGNLGTTGQTGTLTINGGTLETTAAGISLTQAIALGTNGGTFQVDTGTLTLTSTAIISGGSAFGGLTKTGGGILLLQAADTFVGPVTVSNGTLKLASSTALGASSTASNRSTAPVLVNGGTLDINGQTTNLGNVTLQSGTISDSGAGTLGAYSFTLQSGTVSAKLADVAISGNANSNSINVYKTTSGTVLLSGANTYTGSTTISAGTLQSANNAALSTTGGVAVNSTGTLAVNYGGGSDYTQTQVGTLLAKTTFGATTTALAFDTTNASGGATYSPALTMAAGVTKLGSNTLTLGGTNTYTGSTLVSSGTLLVSGSLANTLGVTVSGGSTLTLGATNAINPSATLTLSGGTFNTGGLSDSLAALTLTNASASSLDLGSGASILLFSGINPVTGGAVLSITNWSFGSDSLRFTSNANLLSSSFTVNGGAAAILDNHLVTGYYEVVPEPATWALLAFSLTTVLVFRRRWTE